LARVKSPANIWRTYEKRIFEFTPLEPVLSLDYVSPWLALAHVDMGFSLDC